MAGDGDEIRPKPGERDRKSFLVRVRTPLWLTLALVLAVAVIFLFLLAGKSSVSVGPAVKGAQNVDVTVTICNEVIDQNKVDPRRAELDFEKALTNLGAERAHVRVTRLDCPGAPSTTR